MNIHFTPLSHERAINTDEVCLETRVPSLLGRQARLCSFLGGICSLRILLHQPPRQVLNARSSVKELSAASCTRGPQP